MNRDSDSDESKYEKELRTNEYLNDIHKTNNKLILETYNLKLERYEKLKIYYKVLINCLNCKYRTSEVIQTYTKCISEKIICIITDLICDIFRLYDKLSTLNEKYEKVWIFKQDKWNFRKKYKLENESEILTECKKILDILLSGNIYFKRNDENNSTKRQLRICRRVINDIRNDLKAFLTYYDNESDKELWYLFNPDEDYMYLYNKWVTK